MVKIGFFAISELMPNPTAWKRFFQNQARQKPLVFVHGMRHAVPIGTCAVHTHPVLEIIYHPMGKGRTRIEDVPLDFEEGSIVIHPPGQRHDQEMIVPGEDLCVKIAASTRDLVFPKEHLYLPAVDSPALLEDIRLLSEVGTALTPPEQAIYDLRATATLLSLVHLACHRWKRQSSSRGERYVSHAEQYIRNHFSEIDSVDAVSEEVGVSADYLRHQFKLLRGKSLIRRVTELRIDRAKTLLVHSQLPLKQIASLCGFRDEYYFSKVFRKFTRSTPTRYRDRNWPT
ncbi:MAG: hypothetical protein B9S32_16150 [Verrucomicrobia bacterium Tous-C9LFEB]|nr:MAG: hypothetical protein B9S32_16150 [Verrucomicrobia bacterium Tous-C9LFEB]